MAISSEQRTEILALLEREISSGEIAAQLGLTTQQVAAVKAWKSMGGYNEADGSSDEEALG